MTNTIADIGKAEVILLTGSNTTENHPVLSSVIKRAVKFNGAKLIVVDPRRIRMTEFATLWLQPRVGTDVAWINGLMHVILKEGLHDADFVATRTEGFEALSRSVQNDTPEHVESVTGIPARDLAAAARMFAGAAAGSICYCMGITQHTTGTDNVKSLANLSMLCGFLGIEGGGLNPLRGQNNVQGACDMGGLPNVYPAYQPVGDRKVIEKMKMEWGVVGLPTRPGMTATQMVPAAREGRLKAMVIIGENPMVSDADLTHVEEGLRRLEFLLVQDIFLTETARFADLVLPSRCFAEKEGTFTNTERRVQRVRRAVSPPGEARRDWEILCAIAGRMGYTMDYADSRAIFEEVRRVAPSYAGIRYDRIEATGLHWPCPNPEHPGTPILHRDRFTRGRGVFHAIDYAPPAEQTDAQYPLYLTTGRLLFQYHTGTMTMKTAGLNAVAPEGFVEIAEEDARRLGIDDGEMVSVTSRRGEVAVRAQISRTAAAGTVFMPFHYARAAANQLTNAALDPVCGIPEFKVCAVRLSAAA